MSGPMEAHPASVAAVDPLLLESLVLEQPGGATTPGLAEESPGEPRVGRSTGERVTRRFFELCENPRTRRRMMRLVRTSADSAVAGRLLVALLSRTVLTPLLRLRRVDGAAAKVELVAAQLAGIAVLRYVTRMEPVASMEVESLVALVAPAVQATLEAPTPLAADPTQADMERPRAPGPGPSSARSVRPRRR